MSKSCSLCGAETEFSDDDDLCMTHGILLEKKIVVEKQDFATGQKSSDSSATLDEDDGHSSPEQATNVPRQGPGPSPQNSRSAREAETHVEPPSFFEKISNLFSKSDPILPDELASRFKIIGSVTMQGYTEVWPVSASDSGQKSFFMRHKVAPITTNEVYDKIARISADIGFGLIAHGLQEIAGIHYKYEIIQYPRGAENFASWHANKPSEERTSESRAKWLQQALCSEASRWKSHGLQPLVLHPHSIAVSSAGAFVSDFSSMCALPIEDEFLDKLGLLAPKLAPYSAPEFLEIRQISPKSLVFSIGQLVWQAMLGFPLEYATLRNACAIPFQAIEDEKLCFFLMGALFPYSIERLTLEELERGEGVLPPWSKLHSDAASTSFSIGGMHYWRAEDLMQTAVDHAHWDETCREVDSLLHWLSSTRYANLARELQAERSTSNRSADWVLLRLQTTVRPDAPILWRNHSLDDLDKFMTSLGQTALGVGNEANAARLDIERFFAADLRGAI